MNNNIKIILIVIVTLSIGLGAGYFLFSNNQTNGMSEDVHQHDETVGQISTGEQIWTCSMHPQIHQNEPGLCPICEMDLIPLEASLSDDPLVLKMTNEAVKLADIQTTIVGETGNSGGKTIRLSGKVQADERLASSQVAHVPGRIEKLFVSFTGEEVNKGQKLAIIYSPELITAQRELLEALKLQDLNPGLVEAARNKLRYWKVNEEFIKSIEANAAIQETFTVYADETGVVTNRRIAVGDYIRQGQPLFDLMNLSKVWVLFNAYEEDLANFSIGDPIEFTSSAIPNRTFKTRITFIDPIIDPNTRVASLRTEVNNASGLLKPEMLVYGTLNKRIGGKTNLTIPKSAVLWTGKRSVVYVKIPDTTIPSYQFREVEIGDGLGNSYEVVKGLEAGEELVTHGNFAIDAAAQLNNQTSMMNRNVSLKAVGPIKQLPDYKSNTPIEFKEQLATVTGAYVELKDGLVETDPKKASEGADNLLNHLGRVDMSLVKGDAHLYWMEQLNALQAHSELIKGSADVEAQRKQFEFLSQALINTVKVFGIPKDTLFVQHCPMASNDQGADWLSREGEILNPYFGEKMLGCGFVKDTITTDFKNSQLKQVSRPSQNIHNH